MPCLHPAILPASHLPRRATFLLASLLALLACCAPIARSVAAGQAVPKGRWEVRIVENAKNQYFRGVIVYAFGINLREGGVGSTTASLEYDGTAINDGLLKGQKHIKAVITRPITSATRNDEKLFLYSGGTFKLAVGDPPGHTIKEYATVGGLFPEATIDKLLESFYGVMVFTLEGEDLVFVPKNPTGGKKTVWKKVG